MNLKKILGLEPLQTSASPEVTEIRQTRQVTEREMQESRQADPMLQYGNKDIIWGLSIVNMGPGGEFFTGCEIHARWNRPEERVPLKPEQMPTTNPEVRYRSSAYRLVAFGVLPETAVRLIELRNKDVLG